MILDRILKKKINNPLMPDLAKIEKITQETDTIKTFRLKFLNNKSFTFTPGQFIQLSVFGIGEVPISICSSAFNNEFFEITVRNVGSVTNALFRLNEGDLVGVRGPYGNGYPMNEFKYKNIVLVAGGVGLPPLKSIIEYVINSRNDFESLTLFYGAKNPLDIVYKNEFERWDKEKLLQLLITVDKPTPEWKGNVGVVTNLLNKIKMSKENTVAVICGPPIMMKFVIEKLKKLGFKDEQIYMSMERMMQCGTGQCGHCNIGKKYVCKDGPIFRYDELKELTEKSW